MELPRMRVHSGAVRHFPLIGSLYRQTVVQDLERDLNPRRQKAIGLLDVGSRQVVETNDVAELDRQPAGQWGHDVGFAVHTVVLAGLEVRQDLDALLDVRILREGGPIELGRPARAEAVAHAVEVALLHELAAELGR